MASNKSITSYVQIDSSRRSREPSHSYKQMFNLDPYPIIFTNGLSILTIKLPDISNYSLAVGDRISLSNVVSKNLIFKEGLTIKASSLYARIECKNHGMTVHDLFEPSDEKIFSQVELVEQLDKFYEPSEVIADSYGRSFIMTNQPINYTVQLTGITGVDPSGQSIGNIPVSYLNSTHGIKLLFHKVGDIFKVNPNAFLVELPRPASINYSDSKNPASRIHIKFDYLYGIPVTKINIDTPIISTTPNSITIDIGQSAVVDPNADFYLERDLFDELSSFGPDADQVRFDVEQIMKTNRGGGSNVYMRLIASTSPGYPNASSYIMPLDKTFHNVSSIKLISTEFPNSQRIIESGINNKLYWRNLDDGPHIYQLCVQPGNYSPGDLIMEIEAAFRSTRRISPRPFSNQYHLVKVDIDEPTDTVTFRAFSTQTLLTVSDIDPVLSVRDTDVNMSLDPSFLQVRPGDLIYLTERSVNNPSTLPYTLYNLYTIIDSKGPHISMTASDQRIWFNLLVLDDEDFVAAINSSRFMINFEYNCLTQHVTFTNHGAQVGDLIVTDRFEGIDGTSRSAVYVVTEIIDSNTFVVDQLHRQEPAIVYGDLIFNDSPGAFVRTLDPQSILRIEPLPSTSRTLYVKHPNHQLKVGTEIVIEGSMSVNTVPASVINQKHIIASIIDPNTYTITLEPYAPLSSISLEPNSLTLTYPDLIQLLFTRSDSIGRLLGFTDVGKPTSITPFSHSIKNTDPYIAEDPRPKIPPKLNLSGYNYFYIRSRLLASIHNTGPVSDVFAIVRWTDNPGTVVCDSFVPTTKVFHEPLKSLSEIEIEVVHPDGRLVEFNHLEHSMTLEIVEQILS